MVEFSLAATPDASGAKTSRPRQVPILCLFLQSAPLWFDMPQTRPPLSLTAQTWRPLFCGQEAPLHLPTWKSGQMGLPSLSVAANLAGSLGCGQP